MAARKLTLWQRLFKKYKGDAVAAKKEYNRLKKGGSTVATRKKATRTVRKAATRARGAAGKVITRYRNKKISVLEHALGLTISAGSAIATSYLVNKSLKNSKPLTKAAVQGGTGVALGFLPARSEKMKRAKMYASGGTIVAGVFSAFKDLTGISPLAGPRELTNEEIRALQIGMNAPINMNAPIKMNAPLDGVPEYNTMPTNEVSIDGAMMQATENDWP